MPRRRKSASALLKAWLAERQPDVTQTSFAESLKHPRTGKSLDITQSYISMLIRDPDRCPSNLVACAIHNETGILQDAWL